MFANWKFVILNSFMKKRLIEYQAMYGQSARGPYKHPKDGEKRRKTAKNAQRRRNTAYYWFKYFKNSIIYVSNVHNYYTEYDHYKTETKKISNTVCVRVCVLM